ncbi:MAG: hypothetical protein JO185_17495 [Acidobacteriaceae bacterium]|nr:hypothetical protein [Acidobacteriaceae bacterium]
MSLRRGSALGNGPARVRSESDPIGFHAPSGTGETARGDRLVSQILPLLYSVNYS